MNGILLLQKVPYYGDMDCFQMAIQDEQICLQFISKQSVQNLISKLWHREWSSESGLKTSFKVDTFRSTHTFDTSSYFIGNFFVLKIYLSIVSFGILAPFLVFKNKHLKNYDEILEQFDNYNNEK